MLKRKATSVKTFIKELTKENIEINFKKKVPSLHSREEQKNDHYTSRLSKQEETRNSKLNGSLTLSFLRAPKGAL